ncbi:MAG: hypothetical protein R2882_04855 [Gemmatimonadales bacterium]
MLNRGNRLGALILGLVAVMGGPGYQASEAWAHFHRTQPGHGHQIHVESKNSFDHDDSCLTGIAATAHQVVAVARTRLLLPGTTDQPRVFEHVQAATPPLRRLPPARAPPRTV